MLQNILNALVEICGIFNEMAPYLLFGFLVAGFLSVVISPELVERHLGGKKILPVVKATLFGIPLPLCSCGVIPVTVSLRKHGASRGAATGFLISTPQTGVDSIFVTLSLLGPVFAIFRPLIALVSGVVGGVAVSVFDRESATETPAVEQCNDSCCSGHEQRGLIGRALRYGFLHLPNDIGKPLIVGVIVAGLISAVVPKDFFAEIIGTGFLAMVVMMLVGIPVYVCATASVPVAAALIAKGISPGAALVFLMTGPATNAAAFATIWKIMGGRTALTYLITVAVTALASGLFLDYIFKMEGMTTAATHMHGFLPGYVKLVAAVILLLVLGLAIFRPVPEEPDAHDGAEHEHST